MGSVRSLHFALVLHGEQVYVAPGTPVANPVEHRPEEQGFERESAHCHIGLPKRHQSWHERLLPRCASPTCQSSSVGGSLNSQARSTLSLGQTMPVSSCQQNITILQYITPSSCFIERRGVQKVKGSRGAVLEADACLCHLWQ